MIDMLIEQLQDPNPAVRKRAIMALAKTKDLSAVRPLATVVRSDPVPELRDLALKAGQYIRQQAANQTRPTMPHVTPFKNLIDDNPEENEYYEELGAEVLIEEIETTASKRSAPPFHADAPEAERPQTGEITFDADTEASGAGVFTTNPAPGSTDTPATPFIGENETVRLEPKAQAKPGTSPFASDAADKPAPPPAKPPPRPMTTSMLLDEIEENAGLKSAPQQPMVTPKPTAPPSMHTRMLIDEIEREAQPNPAEKRPSAAQKPPAPPANMNTRMLIDEIEREAGIEIPPALFPVPDASVQQQKDAPNPVDSDEFLRAVEQEIGIETNAPQPLEADAISEAENVPDADELLHERAPEAAPEASELPSEASKLETQVSPAISRNAGARVEASENADEPEWDFEQEQPALEEMLPTEAETSMLGAVAPPAPTDSGMLYERDADTDPDGQPTAFEAVPQVEAEQSLTTDAEILWDEAEVGMEADAPFSAAEVEQTLNSMDMETFLRQFDAQFDADFEVQPDAQPDTAFDAEAEGRVAADKDLYQAEADDIPARTDFSDNPAPLDAWTPNESEAETDFEAATWQATEAELIDAAPIVPLEVPETLDAPEDTPSATEAAIGVDFEPEEAQSGDMLFTDAEASTETRVVAPFTGDGEKDEVAFEWDMEPLFEADFDDAKPAEETESAFLTDPAAVMQDEENQAELANEPVLEPLFDDDPDFSVEPLFAPDSHALPPLDDSFPLDSASDTEADAEPPAKPARKPLRALGATAPDPAPTPAAPLFRVDEANKPASEGAATDAAPFRVTRGNQYGIPREDQLRAKEYLDAAMSLSMNGDNARALKNLTSALGLNPNLINDSFFNNVASVVTGLEGDAAAQVIIDRTERKRFTDSAAQSQKERRVEQHLNTAQNATWGDVWFEVILYTLIVVIGPIFAALVTVEMSRNLLNSFPEVSTDLPAPFQNAELIATAFSMSSLLPIGIVSGVSGVLSLLLLTVLIHYSARMFGGKGTWQHLVRLMLGFYNKWLPLLFLLLYITIAVSFVSLLSPIVLCFVLALVILSLYVSSKTASKIGEAYDFGTGKGCLSLMISLLVIGVINVGILFVMVQSLITAVNSVMAAG